MYNEASGSGSENDGDGDDNDDGKDDYDDDVDGKDDDNDDEFTTRVMMMVRTMIMMMSWRRGW